MVLGNRGHVGRYVRACATALFSAALLTAGCGESSRNVGTPNVAGQSSGGSGGGSSASGGSGGNGGTGGGSGTSGTGGTSGSTSAGGNGGTGGGSGTSGTGGTSGSTSAGDGGSGGQGAMSSGAGGTTEGASGEAGSGGNDGMREPDGLICQSPERCDPGEICTGCTTTEGTSYVCVPNPDDDPAGFAAATEECAPGVGDHFADCDGPEDCSSDRFCVWGHDPQATFGGQCVTEDELPDPVQRATCCFTCGALPLCVLCETETDCPDMLECVEVPGAPSAVSGCRLP